MTDVETIAATMRDYLTELDRTIEANRNVLTAWPFVVRLGGGHGLYLKATIEGRQVKAGTARPITKATRFSRADAERVAAGICNGAGESVAVGYLQALHEERDSVANTLDAILALPPVGHLPQR